MHVDSPLRAHALCVAPSLFNGWFKCSSCCLCLDYERSNELFCVPYWGNGRLGMEAGAGAGCSAPVLTSFPLLVYPASRVLSSRVGKPLLTGGLLRQHGFVHARCCMRDPCEVTHRSRFFTVPAKILLSRHGRRQRAMHGVTCIG